MMKTEYKQVQNMSTPVCEGFVEKKKSDQRRIPIGPSWKKRYCVLSSDGIRLYNSKSNYLCGVSETRVIAMCHVKSVRQTSSLISDGCTFSYFDLETERGSKISFRFKDKIAWSALIQIELIKYKVNQFHKIILLFFAKKFRFCEFKFISWLFPDKQFFGGNQLPLVAKRDLARNI